MFLSEMSLNLVTYLHPFPADLRVQSVSIQAMLAKIPFQMPKVRQVVGEVAGGNSCVGPLRSLKQVSAPQLMSRLGSESGSDPLAQHF